MKEELQTALTDAINKTMSGIDSASEFLASELPDVIQQLLMWYGVSSAIYFVTGLALVGLAWKTLRWCKSSIEQAEEDYKNGAKWTRYGHSSGPSISSIVYDAKPLVYLLAIIQVLVGVCMIDLEWLKIWIAPKLWLIEYAASLTAKVGS